MPDIKVEWMETRFTKQIIAIEEAVSQWFAWTPEDFDRELPEKNVVGMVAKEGARILGFYICRTYMNKIVLLKFAVDPKLSPPLAYKAGVTMLDSLKQRRPHIYYMIRETELQEQKFFAEQGFRAIQVHREGFPDSSEDGFVFHFTKENVVINTEQSKEAVDLGT